MREEDLTLDQIYDPTMTYIYHMSLNIVGIIGAFLYPFVVYVILTKSSTLTEMYKWQLLYYMTISFGLIFTWVVFKPVYLFPLRIFYPQGKTRINREIDFRLDESLRPHWYHHPKLHHLLQSREHDLVQLHVHDLPRRKNARRLRQNSTP